MKTSIASVLAVLFAGQAAYAQDSEPSPNPVEEQEVEASSQDGPAEGSGQTVQAAAATANPAAERTDEAKWDVTAPRGANIRQVPIRTDEGTWMDVDVSPDGRTLAFALLGDIYTMPITGGTPTRVAEGLAWEVQPRFSPDGRRIAFTSDRGGGDNIWIMNVDGSDKRQLTKEDFRLINQASWSPDGNYIVAKKHFTTQRSLGTGEIWIYHVSGGGGVQLVKRASDTLQKELGEPVYSPNGDAVYYSRNVTSGPIFEYAQDSTQGTFAIERYDLATGEVTTAVSGWRRGSPAAFARWQEHRLYPPGQGQDRALGQGSGERSAAHDLWRPRHGHAGNLGCAWLLSLDGLDAGRQFHRAVGRRQVTARLRRWQRRQRHSLYHRRYARRCRCTPPRNPGFARQLYGQDPAVHERIARRANGGVRKPGQAVFEAGGGRNGAASDVRR
tara:strand:+ start:6367 stop:7695 length:1329 start_codon:yes stop_codon:yes gene_type:complete